MGSYYREHVSFPNVTAGPYPPELAAALESVGTNITNTHQDDARHCSVKGCSAPLPSSYPHKMCEECRGRHRVYAMTKRAKRKMEKALLNGSAQNGQPVAWMPPDETGQQEQEQSGQSSETVASPSRQFEVMHYACLCAASASDACEWSVHVLPCWSSRRSGLLPVLR